MVLVGNLLLRAYNLPLVIEFLTAATAILARSRALGGRSRFWSYFSISVVNSTQLVELKLHIINIVGCS
ncbi:hypothetical protein QUB60_22730 [Microcoleus sp. A2-C5]|uniref:hypothetical protein n=1 Tax=unclassified Microcoleus TaxID=2642155 RepID=UPI002FD4F02D